MVGDNVDNFDCQTQLGPLNFYKYISGKFCLLFSHPADFTPGTHPRGAVFLLVT